MKRLLMLTIAVIFAFTGSSARARVLTLDEAFGIALRDSPSLEVSKARVILIRAFFVLSSGIMTGPDVQDPTCKVSGGF